MKEKIINEYPNSKFQLLNSKVQTLTSNYSGITLIALVVTIIVLLILAGVTINIVFSDNGIIKRAQSLEETQSKAELMEKLELIKLNLEITKRAEGKITPENFFEELKNAGIITDTNPGGENIEILPEKDENGDTIYQITTEDGKIIEVVIPEDSNEDIEIEYQGPAESLPPKIRIGNITKTTNSIHLEVEVTRIESGDKISYYYKKHTDTEYTTFKENVTDQTINIEGLEQGQTYIIKIVANNANGQTTKETYGIILGNLEEGTISILSGPTWVGDGTATLELQTSATVGYMEYKIVPKVQTRQIDDTGWIRYTGAITGIQYNSTVLVRLTDGINATEDYLTVEVEDTVEPTVQITKGTVTTKEINVSVTSSDSESGMDATPTYSYYIKKSTDTSYPTSPTARGTFAAYKFENLDDGTQYDVKVTTKDKAGVEGVDEELKIATSGIGGATGDLQTGVITATSSWVGDGTATVTLTKTVTDDTLYIQYQKNGISDSGWQTYTGAITGLVHEDYVAARLTDGRNYGNEATVDITDGTNPTVNIKSSSSTPTSITVNAEASDGGSGIASDATYKFSIIGGTYASYTELQNTTSKTLNQTTGLAQNTTYTIKVEVTDRAGKTGSITKEIKTTTQEVESMTISNSSATMAPNETTTLSATVSPDNAFNKKIIWTSSNTEVATINNSTSAVTVSSGTSVTINAKASGTATITATAEGTTITKTCTITVTQPVTKITLSRTSASLTTGGTTTIIATVEPENATNKTINWTTSNSSRATVSPTSTESGESVTVRAISTGSVTITATTADGTNLSATCSINVSAPTVSVTGISVNPTSVTLDVGGTKSLTASILPSNATNQGKTWTSSNTSVATVSGGTVRAVAPGPATITVKASGNTSKTATCEVKVSCSKCGTSGIEKCGWNEQVCGNPISYALSSEEGTKNCNVCRATINVGEKVYQYTATCSGCGDYFRVGIAHCSVDCIKKIR